MTERELLAASFEGHRSHLHSVAYRMLGSTVEADDAVQEAWLRLDRNAGTEIDNLGGWLTTVVARVCLDMLRRRTARREEELEQAAEDISTSPTPEDEAILADSLSLALLVVLDTLTPAERVAFVLHDMFELPFDEVAQVVSRTPEAARQLASRARRRVRGATATGETDVARRRQIVEAFLAASRGGDFQALLELLDPNVALRSDAAAVQTGAPASARGAVQVARVFSGRARVARLALIDGAPGMVWAPGGKPRVAFAFAIAGGRIVAIEIVAEPERLSRIDLQ